MMSDVVEDVVDARPSQEASPVGNQRHSRLWHFFGKRLPRSEIVFICQMLLIYIVVGVSLFNLTQGDHIENLWVALLGSCLGYILPNPSIDPPNLS